MISKAKEFVKEYWFDKETKKLSKSVTEILDWIKDGKLTHQGRKQYRILVNNKR